MKKLSQLKKLKINIKKLPLIMLRKPLKMQITLKLDFI